jgi:two-component system nitrate/nitrite response regulator NarL
MASVRVAILSDISLFAEGVSRLITAEASLQLVDLINDEALFDAYPSGRPHILLLDGRMDGALVACRRFAADLKILAVAVPDEGPLASDLLIAGARGILRQSAPADEMSRAIALLQQEKIWAPREVVAAAWKKCMPEARSTPRIAGWQLLSDREREVLRYAAAGLGNKELADRLAISEATVKVHLTHIFRKVGCRSRNELAAAYHGIIPVDVTRKTPHPPIIVRRSAN